MESILLSIKKLLGIIDAYTQFDPDLIIYINSAFSILRQLGVGPKEGFFIEDSTATWNDFIQGDPARLRLVKAYVYMKVRLMFDPPTQSSALLDSMKRQVDEFEWRLNVEVDPGEETE